jgi:formamidopyrimidine-DNA glycosylase
LHLDDELDADLSWPPRFTRIRLLTSTGHDVCYTDLRKFGRFHLVESNDPLSCLPLSKLGFDPYLDMPKFRDFQQFIQSYRSKSIELKALLLDQTFCAGIGNWIADEILYQSHFHPRKRLNTLTDEQLKTLHKNIDYVIRTAVDAGGSHKFPPEWLFHFRWTHKRETEDYDKLTIIFDTVGGRTSAYVPQRQALSDDEQRQVDVRLAVRDAKRASKKKMNRSTEDSNDDDDLDADQENGKEKTQ